MPHRAHLFSLRIGQALRESCFAEPYTALLRLGHLIEYIPEPVTLGFTGGIGVVIATLQFKDLLGLSIAKMPEHYLEKVSLLAQPIGHTHWPSVLVAVSTLTVMLLWPRFKTPMPAMGATHAHRSAIPTAKNLGKSQYKTY